MDITLDILRPNFRDAALREVADLWNANARGRHGFFPWTVETLASKLSGRLAANGRLVLARTGDEALAGFAHVTWMHEYGYAPGGSVEAILVGKEYRGYGVGRALIRACLDVLTAEGGELMLVDALGAWPYGFLYTTLADGSERSGVFSTVPELAALFRAFGFHDARKSLVMRAPTHRTSPPPSPPETSFIVKRRTMDTWLDLVFRGRELWDHNLVDARGLSLSRAIYGYMPNESREEKTAIVSLFGVNTPAHCRGRGYATANIARLLRHAGTLGADLVELHVYADNDPALALYERCGFRVVADTMMMIRMV